MNEAELLEVIQVIQNFALRAKIEIENPSAVALAMGQILAISGVAITRARKTTEPTA